MYRKIYEKLLEWKNSDDKKPLMLLGARQVGKTYIIEEFCKNEFSKFKKINLFQDKQIISLYQDATLSSDEKYNYLKTLLEFDLDMSDTILFIDEIQECEELISELKYFCEEHNNARIICAGSLLGVKLKRTKMSFPVGKVKMLNMYPMDFEEFLWAKGYSEKNIEDILKHMQTGTPFSETELSVYKKLFLEYCVLGGMPAVVKVYIEKNLFTDTIEIQKQIQMDYEEDIRKYAEGLDQTKIVSVYRNVPVQLAKENKKFQLSKIDKKARSREYMGCITWLEDAGVITICYCLQYPELPLKGNYDDSKFKIYYPDTGLLIASLDEEAQEDLRANKNLGVYKGALYENFVAEAFVKQGLGLYYYKKENATLEEDFFVRTKDELVPVEVKANKNRSKSLRQLISSDSYGDIHWGIKLADSNVGIEDGIYTFPYFCTFLLKRYLREKDEEKIV